MRKPKALVSWSSGKDSAFALYEVLREGAFDIAGIITTVTGSFDRVSVHGVRRALLEKQARALNIPVEQIEIPYPCSNSEYERCMAEALRTITVREGVTHVVFGDLFLADIRAYRERQMAQLGLQCVFPLWLRDTHSLAREMIASGIEARIAAVNAARLDRSYAGRMFDDAFLADLPADVDPCGENGEFHTFVTNAPMFAAPIAVQTGEIVQRDGAFYADLL